MTVLVTGGAGYIGSHTVVELLNRGLDVVIADNLCNSNEASLDKIEEISKRRPYFYNVDIRDKAGLDQIFKKHKIDCVIHFAGLKAVGESVEKPMLYYDNNINSTITLCKVMAENGVKKIIFSSSATVYSADNEMPLTEKSKVGDCTNPYAETKFVCEKILAGIAKADDEWSVVILRYFNPIGAHPSGIIGEDPRGIPNNLMPFVCQTAIGRREKLYIFGDDYDTPDGTGIRDYIHVVDLALGHIKAIDWLSKNNGIDYFNLGTGTGYSVLDIVNTFKKVNNTDVPYEITERRKGDLAVSYSDPKKSNTLLDWKAERDLDEMCRSSFNFQINNPNGYESR